eukprot:TRINITY_DN65_c0_g1_i1.p1 TRINITY_DN65_c0_g1~~TRINITY_DN65_c0_g1_i1.p1  ORF type:complete len:217 (+),score=66.09 TRINITY_DN65_c0_g1_i1:59-709(+)
MPILHGHPISQPCRSIQWFIDYSGVECEVKIVDLMSGGHKAPEFIAKFPNAQVPAFEDGDLCFGESIAILQYLADGNDIVPTDKKGKARLQEYFGRHLSQVRKFSTEIIRHVFFEKDADEKKKKIAAGIESTKAMMDSFEAHFEKNKFVLGDTLSLADFMFAPEVDQLFMVEYDFKTYKNVGAYIERLKEVKGYTKMREDMSEALKVMTAKMAAKQ